MCVIKKIFPLFNPNTKCSTNYSTMSHSIKIAGTMERIMKLKSELGNPNKHAFKTCSVVRIHPDVGHWEALHLVVSFEFFWWCCPDYLVKLKANEIFKMFPQNVIHPTSKHNCCHTSEHLQLKATRVTSALHSIALYIEIMSQLNPSITAAEEFSRIDERVTKEKQEKAYTVYTLPHTTAWHIISNSSK